MTCRAARAMPVSQGRPIPAPLPRGWRKSLTTANPWRRLGQWVASVRPAREHGKVRLCVCRDYDDVDEAIAAADTLLERWGRVL